MNLSSNEKTVLITGANSGIGKAAALQMASLGAKVIMACSSKERGEQALREVINKTGNQSTELGLLDLNSQASIRQFCEEFLRNHDRLDVLIHNAANFDLSMKQAVINQDGIETIFATNHVGAVLLTHLLLGLMKQSTPSRILTVASKGLEAYPFLDIQFDNLNGERKFSPQLAYYQAKLAQVMFTYDLAEEVQKDGVTVNCVWVPSVALPDDRLSGLPDWQKKIYQLKRKMAITPERMAETYTALSMDAAYANMTGKVWDHNLKAVKTNRSTYRPETWRKLRSVTNQLADIS